MIIELVIKFKDQPDTRLDSFWIRIVGGRLSVIG